MLILGADPEQLDNLALRIRNHADYCEDLRHEIARSIRGIGWDGPAADQFRNRYDTRVAPQISEAAAFLRSAESDLVRNAADQRKASAILQIAGPRPTTTASSVPYVDPFSGRTNTLGVLTSTVGLLPTLGDHAAWSHAVFGKSRFASPIAKAIAESRAAPYLKVGSGALLVFSAGHGLLNWGTDMRQFSDAVEADDLEEAFFSVTDLAYTATATIGTVALIASLAFPPAGVVVGIATLVGLGIQTAKAMGVAWQHHDEIEQALSSALQGTYEFGQDLFEGVADIADAGADFVGDVVDAGADFVGDVVDAGADFVGDVVDAGADFVGDVTRRVGGWLNPFD